MEIKKDTSNKIHQKIQKITYKELMEKNVIQRLQEMLIKAKAQETVIRGMYV